MSKFLLKEINVDLGISVDIGGKWYKLNAGLSQNVIEQPTVRELKEAYTKSWDIIENQLIAKITELAE